MNNIGGVPLHYRIETILKSKIIRREYAPGGQIPTEMTLAKEFNESRVTVRDHGETFKQISH